MRDWAPPGWHWEVLPFETRSLVRNPGDVVESRWPRSMQREPAPEEVVHRSIREEDEHVRRYMYLLDRQYDSRWSFLQRVPSYVSYDPVKFLLFGCTTPAAQHPAAQEPVEISFRASCIS